MSLPPKACSLLTHNCGWWGLQDTDSLVRDASSDAMAAYAQGYTRLYGCRVPGTTSSPVLKVVFDCLAEQKKEGQMGASQALLKVRKRTPLLAHAGHQHQQPCNKPAASRMSCFWQLQRWPCTHSATPD
jgi:hypothetical protein